MSREVPTKSTVSILIEHQGRILMVQEAKPKCAGLWNQPSGHIELGETPIEAAIREAKEETGLDIKILDLFGIYVGPEVDRHFYNFVFRARPLTLSPAPLSPDVMGTKWFSESDLKNLPKEEYRHDLAIRHIEDWMKNRPHSMGFVTISPRK